MKPWWTHLTDGDLRGWLDQELVPARQERLRAHLHTCPACQTRLHDMAATAATTAALLGRLQADVTDTPVPPIRWKEAYPVTSTWRRARSVGIWAIALALLVAVVTAPALRAVAADWLSVFRTERIVTVQVQNPVFLGETIGNLSGKITPDLARRLAGAEGPAALPTATVADARQAAELVGPLLAPAWLPAGLNAEPTRIEVLRPAVYTLRPDVDAINDFLFAQGVPARLAPKFKNTTFRVTTPTVAARLWAHEGQTLAMIQGIGPQVEGVGAVDLQAMADLLAQLAGVPNSVMDQVKAIPDLGRTLVLPVGPGVGEPVTIAGNPGVWYQTGTGSTGLFIWHQSGQVYVVGGDFSRDELLRVIGQ